MVLMTLFGVVWALYILRSITRDLFILTRHQVKVDHPNEFIYNRSICNPKILAELLEQLEVNNIEQNFTCPKQKEQQNEIIYRTVVVNTGSVMLPHYYKESIHPLHIDLANLVRANIENGTAFPVSPINPHPYPYLQRPRDCDFQRGGDVTIMVLVKSYVKHTVQRYAIRETWGGRHLHANVKVAFLLAVSNGFHRYVDREASEFHDIIQEDFIDNYRNNTIKTIMAFEWVTRHCASAKVILFVDDDHMIHIKNILAYLGTLSADEMTNLYTGFLILNGEVNKDTREPWGIPNTEFPYPTWPPYLRGGAFMMSQNVAKQFATAFPYVKHLPVDDAYLGIVASKLGITALHDKRFHQKKEYLHRYYKTYFAFNDYKTRGALIDAWQAISNPSSYSNDRTYALDVQPGLPKSQIRIKN